MQDTSLRVRDRVLISSTVAQLVKGRLFITKFQLQSWTFDSRADTLLVAELRVDAKYRPSDCQIFLTQFVLESPMIISQST